MRCIKTLREHLGKGAEPKVDNLVNVIFECVQVLRLTLPHVSEVIRVAHSLLSGVKGQKRAEKVVRCLVVFLRQWDNET